MKEKTGDDKAYRNMYQNIADVPKIKVQTKQASKGTSGKTSVAMPMRVVNAI